jgi:hypothetical protein
MAHTCGEMANGFYLLPPLRLENDEYLDIMELVDAGYLDIGSNL